MFLMPVRFDRRGFLVPRLVAVVAFCLALGLSVTALALVNIDANAASNDERQTELLDAIGEASEAEAVALRELVSARERAVLARAELARLDAELTIAEDKVTAAEQSADLAASRYYDLFYRVEDGKAVVRDARDDARATAIELYTGNGGTVTDFGVFFTNDRRRSSARSAYLSAVSDERARRLGRANRSLAELEDMAAEAERLRGEAEAAVDAAEARRREVATLRERQAALEADLARAETDETRVVEQIRAAKDLYEEELARLVTESGSIGDMLRLRQQGQPRGELIIARPVPGPIVSGFGSRVHPILGVRRVHLGIDLDGAMGDPIVAAADGVVVWADARGGYGNCVIIEHGNQFATLYGHQSRFGVSIGDTVVMGQTIGYIGSTGLSTGPHLHFEIRDLGVPVDPEPYLE